MSAWRGVAKRVLLDLQFETFFQTTCGILPQGLHTHLAIHQYVLKIDHQKQCLPCQVSRSFRWFTFALLLLCTKAFEKKSFLRFHWSTFRPLFFGVNHKQKLELVWCLLKKNIKNNFFITFFLGKPKAKMMYPIYQLHNNSCVKKWELGFSLSKWNNFCLQKLSKGEGRATEILRLWI